MRRALRWAWNGLVGVSLLLCAATSVLWLRSYLYLDSVGRADDVVQSWSGQLRHYRRVEPVPGLPFRWLSASGFRGGSGVFLFDLYPEPADVVSAGPYRWDDWQWYLTPWKPNDPKPPVWRVAVLPYWVPAAGTGLLPGVAFGRWLARRVARWRQARAAAPGGFPVGLPDAQGPAVNAENPEG